VLALTEAMRAPVGLVVEERDRILRLLRVQRVGDGRLDRLVVLGEGAVDHRVREEPSDALAVHDEWQPRRRILWAHRGWVIRDIAYPRRAVPLDARPLGVPRLAMDVGGCAVVHDSPIEGPAPGRVGVEAPARALVLRRVGDAVPPLLEVGRVPIAA